MMLVAQVQPSKCEKNSNSSGGHSRLEQRNGMRSCVPAVTHVDYSARVQTVDPRRHGRFCRLLESFASETGCPILINTSFNVRGEPIVCSPEDAYRCFMATNMDVLIMEDVVLKKEDQPPVTRQEAQLHLADFPLD